MSVDKSHYFSKKQRIEQDVEERNRAIDNQITSLQISNQEFKSNDVIQEEDKKESEPWQNQEKQKDKKEARRLKKKLTKFRSAQAPQQFEPQKIIDFGLNITQ